MMPYNFGKVEQCQGKSERASSKNNEILEINVLKSLMGRVQTQNWMKFFKNS